MSARGPLLSDLQLRYPFTPTSRRFFEAISVEEGLASQEVIGQAERRLMSALGRANYEPHISELVEFLGFFAAAFVASQDSILTSKFAKKEAERARVMFAKEGRDSKVTVMSECFGLSISPDASGGQVGYSMPFEAYLTLASRCELGRLPRWKLVRQDLSRGRVRMTDNLLNDFFESCGQAVIAEGVRNLRKAQFPRQLSDVRSNVVRYVPIQRPRVGREYEYVESLLKHPVSDGRHRLVWLVLAPYLVNVKKLEQEQAIERIRAFVSAAGETSELKRFVEYNVRRAKRNGLLPPRFSTLRSEHPDIYGLLPKEVVMQPSSEKAPRQSGA